MKKFRFGLPGKKIPLGFGGETIHYEPVRFTEIIICLQVEGVKIPFVIIDRDLGDQVTVLGIKETKVEGGIPELPGIFEDPRILPKLLVNIAGELKKCGFHIFPAKLSLAQQCFVQEIDIPLIDTVNGNCIQGQDDEKNNS